MRALEGKYITVSGVVGAPAQQGTQGPASSYITVRPSLTVQTSNGQSRAVDTVWIPLDLPAGAHVRLSGRIDLHPPQSNKNLQGKAGEAEGAVVLLSGVTNLTAGEPRFDGRTFFNASNLELPAAQVPYPAMLADAPGQRIVVDLQPCIAQSKIFIASMGGFIPPWANPFGGLSSGSWRVPTDAEKSIDIKELEDLGLAFSSGKRPKDSLYLDRFGKDRAVVYWVGANGELRAVADLSGKIRVDPQYRLEAATSRRVKEEYAALKTKGPIAFAKKPPAELSSFERLELESDASADGYTTVALLPRGSTKRGAGGDPNAAKEFYLERQGGIAGTTTWAGPFKLPAVDAATRARIDAWIAANDLNKFGDPKNTFYTGGTPLFDERTGTRIDRYEYILQRHPELGEVKLPAVDAATRARIDAWIAANDLNKFGDPKNTFYTGGTPLFDERTGTRIDRYEYILQQHPELGEANN